MDLYAIRDFIARHSPRYAQIVVDRLTRRSVQIGDFPFSGRILPGFNKEQVCEIIEGSYRIIYYIHLDRVEILAFYHSAWIFPFESS